MMEAVVPTIRKGGVNGMFKSPSYLWHCLRTDLGQKVLSAKNWDITLNTALVSLDIFLQPDADLTKIVAYVMPNLVPPLVSASDALAYKDRLRRQDPSINYLMTLYLHEKITPAVVKGAKAQGIVGIKSYPAGVTTNSSSGVLSYEPFYPVFTAMEQCGMVLNLHGECPSDHAKNITILNAESTFLPTLKDLHANFPKVSSFFVPAIFVNA